MRKPGEYVGLEFVSADATTAANITIKDANNVARTLVAGERLLIDSWGGSLASAVAHTSLFDDKNANGTLDAGELISSLSAFADGVEFPVEGFSVTPGNTPKVIATGAGIVRLSGVGRIVRGTGTGVRPSWKESLVPGV